MAYVMIWMTCAIQGLIPGTDLSLNLRFEAFSSVDGLSQNTIRCLVQDLRGFLWIGTQEGLNRYDGYEFKIYSNRSDDPNSLSANFINDLAIDGAGRLWVATSKGLNLYDEMNDCFSPYRGLTGAGIGNGFVSDLSVGPHGGLWAVTSTQGLFHVDRDLKIHRHFTFKPDDPQGLPENAFWSVLAARDGSIWLGGQETGVSRFVIEAGKAIRLPLDQSEGPVDTFIYRLFEDSAGRVWVGTRLNGLFCVEPGKPPRSIELRDGEKGKAATVMGIAEDEMGRIWAGTHGLGVFLVDPSGERAFQHKNRLEDPKSLSGNDVTAVFKDKTGLLWIGTNGTGLNKHDPRTELFTHITARSPEPYKLPENRASSLFFGNRTLWVGTFGGGIVRLNFDSGEKRIYRWHHPESGTRSFSFAICLFQDRSGVLWAGTYGEGLQRYNPVNDIFERVDPTLLSPTETVIAITQDDQGTLWLGTHSGLKFIKTNPEQQASPPLDLSGSDHAILCFLNQGSKGMWIGFESRGLGLWEPKDQQLQMVDFGKWGVPNPVLGLALSKDGVLWAATARALFRIGRQGLALAAIPVIPEHSAKFGLGPVDFNSLVFDRLGYLWIATNKGILRYDPQTDALISFNTKNGLPSEEYFHTALATDAFGNLWFGGNQGVVGFDPNRLDLQKKLPLIALYEAELVGPRGVRRLHLAQDQAPLVLDHDQGTLSVRFAALDFSLPEHNRFQYRLDPIQEFWQDLGFNRRVTFADLAPGDYRLHVKGANASGVWNESGGSLAIRVVPPFYWSAAAKWFYLIALVFGVLSAALIYRARLRRQASVLVRRKTEHQQREKMEALGRLAGGVAHEFNNMLASVLGFSYLAKAELSSRSTLYQYLQEIETASLHAKDMVSRILTFSRKGRPRYQPIETQKVIAESLGLAKVAFSKEMDVREDLQAKDTWIWGDATQLSQVILNLCTNADQAMSKSPRILRISLREIPSEDAPQVNQLLLQVEDTGSGMTDDVRRQIFDPYFTTKEPGRGTGLGLSLVHGIVMEMKGEIRVSSQPGKGTRFDIFFPILHVFPASVSRGSAVVQSGTGQRVLWVDDDPSILKFGCTMLKQMGYVPESFQKPQEVLERLRDGPPVALIICDWVMPEMPGKQLVDALANGWPGLPVLICTGQPNLVNFPNDRDREKNIPILGKPFTPEALAKQVHDCLEGREAARPQIQNPSLGVS